MVPLVLAAALAAPVNDKDVPVPTRAMPPSVLPARVEKDVVIVSLPQVTLIETKRVVEVKEGAEVKKKEVIDRTQQIRMRPVRYPLKDVRAFTADGKKLDAKALAERLKKETPVMVAGDDKPVDRFYLGALKDDGVVLVLPRSTPTEVKEDDGRKPKDPPRPMPKDG
jgi:hypothetical protein